VPLQPATGQAPLPKEGPTTSKENPTDPKESPTTSKESLTDPKESPTDPKEGPTDPKESLAGPKDMSTALKESPTNPKESQLLTVSRIKLRLFDGRNPPSQATVSPRPCCHSPVLNNDAPPFRTNLSKQKNNRDSEQTQRSIAPTIKPKNIFSKILKLVVSNLIGVDL